MLGIIAASVSWATGGNNLGLFFGGIVAATLLVPPTSLNESKVWHRLMVAGAVCDGIVVVWLIAMLAGPISIVQWFLCCVLLVAWCLMICGVAHLSKLLIKPTIPAAAIPVVLGLLWLSWPIWLSQLNSPPSVVSFLVSVNPLLAINGVLSNLDIWVEQSLTYRSLVRLGQDVPYEMPGVLRMMLFHSLTGGAALLVGWLVGRR